MCVLRIFFQADPALSVNRQNLVIFTSTAGKICSALRIMHGWVNRELILVTSARYSD